MIRVTIVYPADPLGVIAGGIDTCIRDFIRSAPSDFQYSMIGLTTDTKARPVGQWTECQIGGRVFHLYPVFQIDNAALKYKLPLVARLILHMLSGIPPRNTDIYQFHRIEPVAIFRGINIPRVTIIHQNMEVLYQNGADIRWKHAPRLYFKFEDWLIPQFKAVYCVHEQGVANYKRRYPRIENRFSFLPTWMNPDIFYPANPAEKLSIRRALIEKYAIPKQCTLAIWVGRIDSQKNPLRLIKSLKRTIIAGTTLHLLMVGDGKLRAETEALIDDLGIKENVTLTGLLATENVAELLRGSDMMILSSDYEGMARCVIEALGCGIPVAATDAGEIRRVLHNGKNGAIASEMSEGALAEAIMAVVANLERYAGKPCTDAVIEYTPTMVLDRVYEDYRRIAKKNCG